MNDPNQDIELIENYLMKTASPEEIKQVEDRLLTDQEFAQLFHELKIVITGIKKATSAEILNELKKKETEIKNAEAGSSGKIVALSPEKKVRKLWLPLSIAASVLMFLGIFWMSKNPFGNNQNEPLAAYYQPLPTELLYNFVRSEPDTALPAEAEAAKALKENNLEEAAQILNSIIDESGRPNDSLENVIRFYSNVLLQNIPKNCASNKDLFEALKASTNSSKWYGTVLIDETLLLQKCKLDGVSENKALLNQMELSEYDQDRWQKIEPLL
jgi:hypothetical protein